ncbi:MAG: hypothetical protein JHC61_00170 [Burkholderiaceae bacterium]|nr:hypothetical protein [Burkholderiaceae bacterium]
MESKTAYKGISIRRVKDVKGPPIMGTISQKAVQARFSKNLATIIAQHGLPEAVNSAAKSSSAAERLRRVAGR